MKEVWKDIPGYRGFYQASNLGRIRSLDRKFTRPYQGETRPVSYKGKILSPCEFGPGYLYVNIKIKGIGGIVSVHRLVASAFLGDHPDLDVNHIDFDRTNNRIDNLEWVTRSQNAIHNFLHGSPKNAKLNPEKIKKLRGMYEQGTSIKMLSKFIGLDPVNVRRALQSKSWGFVK